jgi:uncharacterized membrane protein (UPF0127 family)
MLRQLSLLLFALTLVSCGPSGGTNNIEDLTLRDVVFPSGQKVKAEVMARDQDMMRGMMFRDSIAPDRGMLFIHTQPGLYRYWMYQVRIPLDIIWMDRAHQIVEISANTPPCQEKSAQQCPNFGGSQPAMFVLELGGGMAQKYGLKVGDRIEF